MDVCQGRWDSETGWSWSTPGFDGSAHLVLAFGGQHALLRQGPLDELAERFRNAQVVACSTEAEIEGGSVFEDAIVATSVRFRHTQVQLAHARIIPGRSNHEAGVQLAELMGRPELAHLFVISSAVNWEAGELTRCLTRALPRHVALTGAVARAVCVHGQPLVNALVAVGFYGLRLHVGYGALDGKDPFGAESRHGFGGRAPELAILASSCSSPLAPTQCTQEEVRSLRQMLGPQVALTGFRAQASVSPFLASPRQTTVTTLREE